MLVVIKILIALGLDQLLGEPKRWHPLVGFGNLASAIEGHFNSVATSPEGKTSHRIRGLAAWSLAVMSITLTLYFFSQAFQSTILDIILLYLCIGRRSLFDHSKRVHQALINNDVERARHHTCMMVSRECSHLDAVACARATTESVLENGNDSIFATLFWFSLLGGPGAVLYRLANTLDAMWGYRNERYLHFGWAAARMDDALNFIPARLCAVCYSLAGKSRQAFNSWKQYAKYLSSPNAGPVMCAGAGALDIQLGGPATYHGKTFDKPFYGGQHNAAAQHILMANTLVDKALFIYLVLLLSVNLCL
jgi:adenosylcobinamide-phosphate synthase